MQQQGYWVILLSFFTAYVLAVLPLPQWLQWLRPEWVALCLIYWVLALPHRVGILTALVLGLGLDVLEGALLGQNAFALVVVALLCLTLYQRLRVFSLWQQAGTVFVLVGVNQLVCQWVQNLQGVGAPSLLFLLPAVSSALLWPLVLHLLRQLRRHYMVA
ncbi:MAG: rod shape-determining protein MreD [Pseudomonadales bacterium]|nr:rod shape-determining protein MreD [Halieaceae bacterium]MCP5165256.1 rod shape-determining protein MreD [Pseudomonadales bacterium]MCP5189507.1 rod shape-determining protein MreD [Pseudomonadales bacterium]MCP5204741.1 rod shape-determining protein MreD [Pseudomonadales bacterium]